MDACMLQKSEVSFLVECICKADLTEAKFWLVGSAAAEISNGKILTKLSLKTDILKTWHENRKKPGVDIKRKLEYWFCTVSSTVFKQLLLYNTYRIQFVHCTTDAIGEYHYNYHFH